jgi:monooxygenase
MNPEHFDVVIIGAGLSGIGAGVHLGKHCPGKSYVILENRDAIGGTWDLFRYPGIRSDSDMYTLGYSFKPWTEQKAIADGPSIWRYVNDTAREYGIDRHIRFKHKVTRAAWSSAEARWTIEAEHAGQTRRFTANFLFSCAGYYNYEQGYLPDFKGRERFKGAFIHAQHWPENLDYSGKRVIIIGSGATAVTLAPAMSDTAAHVTMLQRSPTYMVSLPAEDKFANWLRRVLPPQLAYDIARTIRVVMQQVFFRLARTRPKRTRERLLKLLEEQIGAEQVAQHFTPRYNPWEQRLCLVPDNDMFLAIKQGKVSVVTDTIDSFTETGIKLMSGQELQADVVVAATGLALQMMGGAALLLDGVPVDPGAAYVYRGAMFTGVPNFFNVFGYTNASWTLKADLIGEYSCRIVNYMDAHNFAQVVPRPPRAGAQERPFVDFSSGYFERARHMLPKQTDTAPWKLNQSYVHDILALRYGRVDDGVLEFTPRGRSNHTPRMEDRAPLAARQAG